MVMAGIAWGTVGGVCVAGCALLTIVGAGCRILFRALINAIRTELRPNGLDTDMAGDILKRTEGSVTALRIEFQEHCEADAIDKAEIRAQLERRRRLFVGRLVAWLGR